ncbi:MAG TPA: hypothetical protein VFH61_09020 [Thermoleophilia bacterium]|nr:hypothetical protein [Thermoleophilia bacterium]
MIKPLPKYVSVAAVLANIFAALNVAGILAVVPSWASTSIIVGSVVFASLSHSLTGTGGKAV